MNKTLILATLALVSSAAFASTDTTVTLSDHVHYLRAKDASETAFVAGISMSDDAVCTPTGLTNGTVVAMLADTNAELIAEHPEGAKKELTIYQAAQVFKAELEGLYPCSK
jgi:hypothetical protein